jgi:transcriptional regulator with PAS, ATPase and Fis domain
MQEGRFRTDLYYRLCADTISTPSLFERIRGDDDERRLLLLHLAQREIDEDAELLVAEVEKWIDENLGPDYPWPGNVRELVQCLRNVLIRREYHPAIAQRIDAASSATDQLAAEMRSGNLTADELLRRYCTLVYREVGSFEQAARRLKLDRRTVRAKVEEA